MITEQQYTTVKQPHRELYYKINLLNYQMQIVDDISGTVLSDSWTISANSDVRRSGTITLVPDDEQAYKIQAGSKIWLDKYVQVYIGIKNNATDEIIYNNMGIYLINNPSKVFDSTNNQITLQLVDLMAKLTGLRNGNLWGYEYQLLEGQYVRDIIRDILEQGGFDPTKTIITIDEDDYQTIQYDMSVDGTATLYDILTTINQNQYINYQMYFDVDGYFHFEKIPSGDNEMVMADDDVWKPNYISHEVSTNYEEMKNDIIVLGKMHTADQYCSDVVYHDNDDGTGYFTMNCAGIKRERDHMKISFTTPADMITTVSDKQQSLNLNSYGTYPIKTANGSLDFVFRPDTYYVCKSQGLERYNATLTGAADSVAYHIDGGTVSEIEDMESLVGCYVTKNAISLSAAVSENCKITSVMGDAESGYDLWLSKTLDAEQELEKKLCYIYRNDTSNIYWQFMGEYQPRAEIKDENPNSPFYVNGTVGEVRITLSGGDYDNISTSEEAMERAKWELYTRCRLNDTLTITCIPIYWMDVNWVVEIKLPNEDEPRKFITKEISTTGGINGTQSITLMSYYPYYDDEP
jgi:hypothetical protein